METSDRLILYFLYITFHISHSYQACYKVLRGFTGDNEEELGSLLAVARVGRVKIPFSI